MSGAARVLRDLYAGFDPGTRYVGWCVTEATTGSVVDTGAWHLGTSPKPYTRLLVLAAHWRGWPYWERIVAAAVEGQFVDESDYSALELAASRGWIEGRLAMHDVREVDILQPTFVKSQFTGNSKADKKAMEWTANRYTSLKHIPATLRNHAADAVGIAHVGWSHWHIKQREKAS